tara:strand:- start:2622 stop:2918 length:297 start_codon:yes stop_codon:yes gene_type:complete
MTNLDLIGVGKRVDSLKSKQKRSLLKNVQSVAYQKIHLELVRTMDKLYRIEELGTVGWTLLDERSVKLTKEQAKARLESALAEGLNPNRLRAIPEINV